MQFLSPIPDPMLAPAARLWWSSFAPGPWRRIWRIPPVRAAAGLAAVTGGQVVAVMGLRDASGGFLGRQPVLASRLFRAAPPTQDLVIDGIVVCDRRRGVGRQMVALAEARARSGGHPGLRAEVRLANRAGLAFWRSIGFAEVGRGRYGWPWDGQVVVMRRGL